MTWQENSSVIGNLHSRNLGPLLLCDIPTDRCGLYKWAVDRTDDGRNLQQPLNMAPKQSKIGQRVFTVCDMLHNIWHQIRNSFVHNFVSYLNKLIYNTCSKMFFTWLITRTSCSPKQLTGTGTWHGGQGFATISIRLSGFGSHGPVRTSCWQIKLFFNRLTSNMQLKNMYDVFHRTGYIHTFSCILARIALWQAAGHVCSHLDNFFEQTCRQGGQGPKWHRWAVRTSWWQSGAFLCGIK